MERIILHSDLNNFYASVECLRNQSIRDKPVAVAGDKDKRHGIVLAKNYIAKAYGVRTGEALWEAKKKCPDIIFVNADFERYIYFSDMVRSIYAEYTDQIENFGPDECWLDMTKSKIFGSGEEIANAIRERIKNEIGITASIGVSYNKIFAKLGSDLKKPDATTVISSENYKDVVWPLPVRELLYVGRQTEIKLRKNFDIKTIGDLANADVKQLKKKLGLYGYTLWVFANGWDNSSVRFNYDKPYIKSVGNSTTAPRDLISDEDIKLTLYLLCENVALRLRELNLRCRTVQISVRGNDLEWYQRQSTLRCPACVSDAIFKEAFALYKANHPKGKPVRTIGVRACGLVADHITQTSYFPDSINQLKNEELERAIDKIRSRYGSYAIRRGLMLEDKVLSDLNLKEEHLIHPESYFRG
jgi:DNA polymerase-4